MTDVAAADRRLATLFVSFEREAFFDMALHDALEAESAPPVIGLNRRALTDPAARDRALERVSGALQTGGGPLVVVVEGTLLLGRDALAFRLPQGRLFTGRELRRLLDALPTRRTLLILDCAVLADRARVGLEEAYAEALAADFGDAEERPGGPDIVCLARAPNDANPLAPRLAAAWTQAAAIARARAGDGAAWLELADLIAHLPSPGARPVIEPDLPEIAKAVGEMAGDGLDAAGRIILGGFVVSTTDMALPAAGAAQSPKRRAKLARPEPAVIGALDAVEAVEPGVSPPAPGGAIAAMEKAVKALLHHTVPKLMRVHREHLVDVAVSKDLSGGAAADLGERVATEEIRATGLMAVRLVDEKGAFEVRALSQQIQDIDFAAQAALGLAQPDGPPRGLWRFQVTPKRVGAHRLGIEAACYVRGADGAPVLVPSAVDRVEVRVRVNLGYGLKRVASWLLLGVLGVLVFKFGVEAPLEAALAEGGWPGLLDRIVTGG